MKIAVLDLYDGEANEGMRCLVQLIEAFKDTHSIPLTYQIFDVRGKQEVADLSFDAYISSGGPGSPLDSVGSSWEKRYFNLMDNILLHNKQQPENPKQVLLICHSFQLFCRHYNYGQVTKRKSTAFGIMPVHLANRGKEETLLGGLTDPFYAVDSRDYQVLQPNEAKLAATGGYVACIEKERPHVKLERATMAIRFNENIFGMQFHGEADTQGMTMYFNRKDKADYVKERYGEEKYQQMVGLLESGHLTPAYDTIIPRFMQAATLQTISNDV